MPIQIQHMNPKQPLTADVSNRLLKLFTFFIVLLLTGYTAKGQSAILTGPPSSSTNVDAVSITYTVSDPAGAPQAVQVVFTCTSGPCLSLPFTVMTLNMKPAFLVNGTYTFSASFTNLNSASNDFTPSPAGVSMADGVYQAYVQYTRPASVGSTILKSTTRSTVVFDVNTQTPIIKKPVSGTAIKTNSTDSLGYTLPEASFAASLTFLNTTTAASTKVTLANNILNNTVSLKTNRLLANNGFTAVTPANDTILADGVYTLTLAYQDQYAHPKVSVTSTLVIDNNTLLPVINSPVSDASLGGIMNFNVKIPENYARDSLYLVFSKTGSSDTVRLVNTISPNINQDIAINAMNMRGSSYVTSSTRDSLASGIYTIKLSYTDTLKNARVEKSITNIFIGNATTAVITTGGPTTVCAGNAVNLSSNASGGNQWYLNGNLIPGATGTTYAATATGDYTVIFTSNGYASPVSAAVSVAINPLPSAPIVTVVGDTSFCSGSSTVLKSNYAIGNQWYKNGTAITGATDTAYTASVGGIYTLIHTNGNGCSNTANLAKNITVYNLPAAPVITATDSTTIYDGSKLVLASSGVSGMQWYKDSASVSGATANLYSATVAGNYTAVVTDSNHCSSSASNIINVRVVALPNTTNRNGSTGTREAVNKNGAVIQVIHH
jgi:hypothetical protein